MGSVVTMKYRPRFDLDRLRELAEEKAFVRGEKYFHEGRVSIVSLEKKRVLAKVAGTEEYRCVLTGRGRKIGGECTCPAFEDFGFCKHLVAAALAANDADPEDEIDRDAAMRLIDRYLREKDNDSLVEILLETAERDENLFHRLNLAATSLYGDERSIGAQLRESIDGAIREKIADPESARRWAVGVKAALDNLAGMAAGQRAGHALELADRALARISRARERTRDVRDVCDDLLKQVHNIHISAVLALRPDPIELARNLFARELDDPDGVFSGAAESYAAALGDEGLALYRRLASEAWADLPSLGRHGRAEMPERYDRLLHILDFFAERGNDLEFRIALRAKDLSSPSRYLRLAQFCLEHGRREEALRRAEEGLWMFEDDSPDIPFVLFVGGLLTKSRRFKDAEECLWVAFEKKPSLELYKALRTCSGIDARQRATRFLKNQITLPEKKGSSESSNLLIALFLCEEMFDEAWIVVRTHGASPQLLRELAQSTEVSHPRETLDVYTSQIEELIGTGGADAYKEIGWFLERIAPLQGPSRHASYLGDLKSRYAHKRSLMRHLP
jgi:tetratricopeptide (TPR) repeat protein